jgi:transcriptional regulator CtsR
MANARIANGRIAKARIAKARIAKARIAKARIAKARIEKARIAKARIAKSFSRDIGYVLYHFFGRDRGYDIISSKKGYVQCLSNSNSN